MKYLNNKYINIYDHQKTHYNKILEIMLDLCSTFQIVELYGDLDFKELELNQDLIQINRSNEWPGTIMGVDKAYVYSFKMTDNIKSFLDSFDSFIISRDGCYVTRAFDDQSDLSFFEKGTGDCLLYTITHEGDVFLREDIYNKYFK